MVYILLTALVIAVSLFSFANYAKSRQAWLFRLITTLYVFCTFLYLLYLCKDPYYLGVFMEYIPLPRSFILMLYTLRLSRFATVRLLNANSLLFLFCNLIFALGFYGKEKKTPLIWAGAAYCLIQLIMYDPGVYRMLYSWLYPSIMPAGNVVRLYAAAAVVTRAANTLVILACISLVLIRVARSPQIQIFRLTIAGVGISYTLLLLLYLFFFNPLPSLLIRYSKAADTVTFLPLMTVGYMRAYRFFPYIVLIFLGVFAVSFFRLLLLRHRLDGDNLQIAQNIRAANVSSRLLCHYLKNEVLAISAELETMEGDPKETAASIQKRCDLIYDKLDGIHLSIRENIIDMRKIRLLPVVEQALSGALAAFEKDEHTITAQKDIYPPDLTVMADAVFLEQALRNLFHNSMEAMAESEIKIMRVTARRDTRWVSIDVSDTGCGIKEEDLENIFMPLFSTKPTTKNWGIGLTLVYKVVSSFGGRISVKSRLNSGTVFQVLLPAVSI